MLKNHKIQMFGMAMLIVPAALVTLSAVRPAAPVNEVVLIPITGNEDGLAQYHRSEWGTAGSAQKTKMLPRPAIQKV